jgi:TetR/AcrR family transcriptional regulator, transcriptional repressor for nem operon
MGRPREFDRDQVLDRAVEVFWTRGYSRTSVSDLTDSMGIQRGSLYAAFGDKHQLFLEALDRYEERFYRETRRLLEERPAREGIREVFLKVLTDCACEGGRKGCFITNTAVALAEDDPDTAVRVRANLLRVEDAFEEAIGKAQARGEIAKRHPSRALARFLSNGFQGLRVLSRCSVALDVLHDAVEVTLSVLNESAPAREPSINEPGKETL